MYRSFFGLRERPFDLTPNPRFLVLTDAHREALSHLEYGIASRRGITVLVGEAGTGKTTLIRAALQRQPEHVHAVHLQNPALTRTEFVSMLASRFELSETARDSKAALLIELESVLRARQARGESSVLIVDEAQALPMELLEELRLLGNIETDEAKLLSIVLAGQPELGELLDRESLRQLKQRVALRCELRPLSQTETAGYLAGRVRSAGGVGAQVFTREAVMLIHQRSRGIPRTVSVIADNALVTAFAVGRKPINSEIIAEVCRDLVLGASPEAAKITPMAPSTLAAVPERHQESGVLRLEHSEPEPEAAEAAAEPNNEGRMFNSMSQPRRMFSLFSKSGSR
jgi:general secretion pathway protein A